MEAGACQANLAGAAVFHETGFRGAFW